MSVIGTPTIAPTPTYVKLRGRMNRDEGEAVAETTTRETISVPEAGRILGLSRDGAYAAVARGEIPVLRIGRKLLVPRRRLMAMLEAPAEKGAA